MDTNEITIREQDRIAYCIVVTFLGFVFVSLRIYFRHWIQRRLPKTLAYIAGDAFLALGLVVTIAFASVDIWIRNVALNLETNWGGLLQHIVVRLKVALFQYIAAVTALYSIKFAFLCFYHDMSETLGKRTKRTLICITAFTTATFVVAEAYILLPCRPIRRYWELSVDNCLGHNPVGSATLYVVLHIVTDILIMAIGYMILRQSHSNFPLVPVVFIFLLGFATLILNCVRYSIALELVAQTNPNTLVVSPEGRKLEEWLVMVTLAILNVALIATSLPTFRVWWRKIMATDEEVGGGDRVSGALTRFEHFGDHEESHAERGIEDWRSSQTEIAGATKNRSDLELVARTTQTR